MNVHALCAAPPDELARSLTRFEAQFTYPLGPGRSFRIAHGEDYPRFFRAMGEAACFVAERQGEVLGTCGAALRQLLLPAGHERLVIYLGDLKIALAARGGRALVRLAGAVRQWAGSRAAAAFAVVMDGTRATPLRYTGRLGVPPFRELGKVVVLRVPTAGEETSSNNRLAATEAQVDACYRRLSAGWYACPGGNPAERSEAAPQWLVAPDGRACGRLEDTRRAKRLIADDGTEMRSAHLSCFAFQDPGAGADLLRDALRRAAGQGLPALFVAVVPPDAEAIGRHLGGREVVAAPATIYGTGLEPGPLWNINTAEI
jgi:hypothetical protein